MRTVTKEWMEVSVRYTKTTDEGNDKRVSERYVVVADSFAEAEQKTLKELAQYADVDLEITGMGRPAYREVFFSDNPKDDKFYAAKLCFITIDERTEKEKRSKAAYLVQAGSLNGAVKNVDDALRGSTLDYVSISANESKIIDVFED